MRRMRMRMLETDAAMGDDSADEVLFVIAVQGRIGIARLQKDLWSPVRSEKETGHNSCALH